MTDVMNEKDFDQRLQNLEIRLSTLERLQKLEIQVDYLLGWQQRQATTVKLATVKLDRRSRFQEPKFLQDPEVTAMLVMLHRAVTIRKAHHQLLTAFGSDRVPSKSAIGRYWLRLDNPATNTSQETK